jgi:hypothetical protein
MSIRLRGSISEILPHWPVVVDGVLFIDSARPATRWIARPSMGPVIPNLQGRETATRIVASPTCGLTIVAEDERVSVVGLNALRVSRLRRLTSVAQL